MKLLEWSYGGSGVRYGGVRGWCNVGPLVIYFPVIPRKGLYHFTPSLKLELTNEYYGICVTLQLILI